MRNKTDPLSSTMAPDPLRAAPTPPGLLTYQLGDKLVYVRPADNYEQALDTAQKEFREDLAGVPRDRIAFSVLGTMGGARRAVRISEHAWAAAVSRLPGGEVVDISVLPPGLPRAASTNAKEPPQYLSAAPQTQLLTEKPKSSAQPLPPPPRDPSPAPPVDKDRWRNWLTGNY